jgi:hypothetical protein
MINQCSRISEKYWVAKNNFRELNHSSYEFPIIRFEIDNSRNKNRGSTRAKFIYFCCDCIFCTLFFIFENICEENERFRSSG